MDDLIRRQDAIGAKPEYRNEDMLDKEKSTYNKGWNDCNDAWVAIIKALPSADAVQGCDGCIYNTRIPQEQCLRCKRYWRDSYKRKGGDEECVSK